MGNDFILPDTAGGGGILAAITTSSLKATVTSSDYYSSSKNFSVFEKTLVCNVGGSYTFRYCYAHTYSTAGKILVNGAAVATLPTTPQYGAVETVSVNLNTGDVVTASTLSPASTDRYSVLVVYILKE